MASKRLPSSSVLSLAVLAALASGAQAQAPDAPGPDRRALDAVIVTATREADAVGEVSATASVIDREQIERQLAADLRDLFRYEPGVSVRDLGSRFGLQDVSIRGIGGNRVALEVDGVPAPDAFSIGSFSNQGRNFVDVELLQRAEIVRGPSSSLYGSDALGGIVALVTKDPEDLIAEAGSDRDSTLWAKFGYAGADDSSRAAVAWAGRGQAVSTLVHAAVRHGHSRDTPGGTGGIGSLRDVRDPVDYRDASLLGKWVLDTDASRTRVGLELLDSQADTRLLSGLGQSDLSGQFGFPYLVDVTALEAEDEITRQRLSIDQERSLDAAFAERLRWQLYFQDSRTEQHSFEARTNTINGQPSAIERERLFLFDQQRFGGELVFGSSIEGAVSHRLTWGAEFEHTDTEQLRDGLQRNLATGQSSPVVSPDVFPVRDFPVSTTLELGAFVQDVISFGDGAFSLVPALRVDHYDLDPELDPIFAEDNPGITPEGITRTEVSPKLGLRWAFTEDWALVAQYAHGFRAPPYNDVNLGFTNLQFGYTALPNRDLEPESSDGIELGLRYAGERGFLAATVFHTRYDDFIESLAFVGIDPQTGLIIFQSQNRERVTIEGAELRAGLELGGISGVLDGFSLQMALAYADGEDEATGQPLQSVDPLELVLGLHWESGPWYAELVGTGVARQDELPAEAGSFEAPGYAVFDLLAGYRFGPNAGIELGVFNLGDRSYWNWASVRGRPADDPALLRYAEPGRTLCAQFRWQW